MEHRGGQGLARRRDELHVRRAQDQNRRRVHPPTCVYESLQDDATFDSRSPHRLRVCRTRHPHQRRKEIWYKRRRVPTNNDEPVYDNWWYRRRSTDRRGPMQRGSNQHGGNHRVHDEPLERCGILSSRQFVVHGRLSAVSSSERYRRRMTWALHLNYGMVTTGCDLDAREAYREGGASSRTALHVNRAAVRFGDPLADGETEAGAGPLAR